jgi:hypothetical protein
MQTSRTRPVSALLGLAAALLSLASAPSASAQTHIYTLNNTYADSNGGPSLVPVSNGGTGTLSTSGYTFGKDQGLSLSNAIPTGGTFSIDLTFSLTDLSGYKKLIDFHNLTTDDGLYLLNGQLNFFPVTGSPGPTVLAANQSVTVDLTRDGTTKLVTGSINGVQQFSFTDTTNLAVFDQPGGLAYFFVDDNATSQNEAGPGTVTRITITASPVPEASTTVSLGLLALGLGGLVVAGKRRKA